jgi:hypothetical protein
MQNAQARHPGGGLGRKLKQLTQLSRERRDRQEADHAERHADRHGLHRRTADHAAAHGGVVQGE